MYQGQAPARGLGVVKQLGRLTGDGCEVVGKRDTNYHVARLFACNRLPGSRFPKLYCTFVNRI